MIRLFIFCIASIREKVAIHIRNNSLIGGILILSMSIVCIPAIGHTAGGPAKVEICHIPPDDPAFHTIKVLETALSAHVAHGDLISSQCSGFCGTLCDDGDACTIDDCVPGTEECTSVDARPTVDCNDGLACTVDSCDPAGGCTSVPNDELCDDGDEGTSDICDPTEGCVNEAICDPVAKEQQCNDECIANGGPTPDQCYFATGLLTLTLVTEELIIQGNSPIVFIAIWLFGQECLMPTTDENLEGVCEFVCAEMIFCP